MASPTTTRGTERREQEIRGERREGGERRIIIPRRAGETETDAVRQERDRAVQTIHDLQRESRRISVPTDVAEEIDSRSRILRRLRESGVPFLADRYNNEIDLIQGVLDEAQQASQEHRSVDANRLLERAAAMMAFLGSIYEAEIGVVIFGVPPGRAGGSQGFNDVLDSVEIVLLDFGTANARNAQNVLRAVRAYTSYANVYNTDDISIRGERDRLLDFIVDHGIRRGTDAQSRGAQTYTDAQAAEDERMLSQFESTIGVIASGLRRDYISRLTMWREDLMTRIGAIAAEDHTRELLESLRADIDAMLDRLRVERRAKEVTEDEILMLENRYLTATGRAAIPTRSQRDEQLRQSAASLRGTSTRSPREGTPEWFGQIALDALARNERDIAALAIAFGLLERVAAGTRGGARTYLGEQRYRQILDVIMLRVPLNPVLASRMAGELDLASLAADADRMERDYRVRGSGSARERLQLINDAVRIARERISDGDAEGARRILDMASQYGTFLSASVSGGRFRDWAGREDMESAIRADIGGADSRQQFDDALTRNHFAGQVERFRSELSDWGRGIAEQKRLAESAIAKVEELIRDGRFGEAQAAMMRILMYAESVERLGVRRGGRIESMNPRYDGSGMERALRAFVRGDSQVDGRGIDTVFTEGYIAAQRVAVDIEAARLADTATRNRWTLGRDAVDAALQRARERAQQGDFEGAFRLLGFVQEYYGAAAPARAASGGAPAQPARREGWRYALSSGSGRGFSEGREQMLDGIRMETDASTPERHSAAARLLENGSRRVAETAMLVNSYTAVRQKYMGEADFIAGDAASRGQVPIGSDTQGHTVYFSLASVRRYEAEHRGDRVLGSGPTLETLFTQLQAAASNGDTAAYNRISEAIFGRYDSSSGAVVGGRFWLVTQRAVRQQNIVRMTGQLLNLEEFVNGLPAYEGSDSLRPGIILAADALLARLRAAVDTDEDLNARGPGLEPQASIFETYGSLIASVERERRTAVAMANVGEQLRLHQEYYRAVGYIGGEMTETTRRYLDTSRAWLGECQTALREGRFEDAERAYDRAIAARSDALREYWARNVASMHDALTVHRARPRLDIEGPDERFFPVLRLMNDDLQIQPYLDAHHQVFHDILFGSVQGDPQAYGERMQRRLQGTTMIEASIFGIPAGSRANVALEVMNDVFKRGQADVRGYVYNAWRLDDQLAASTDPDERADLNDRMTREFSGATSTMQSLQLEAETNRQIGTAAVFGVGVASLFIPVVGPYISGTIFVSQQLDSMATEYRMEGSISTTSWVLFGLTVATFGLAGAGAILRTVATSARVGAVEIAIAGDIVRAEQMLTTAARLNVASRAFSAGAMATGGVMIGIMEVSAGRMIYQAYQETDPVRREILFRDGIMTAAMGLFPILHMGVSGVYRGLTASPRLMATAALEEVTPARAIAEGEAAEAPLAARLRTPEGLFEFMGRLRSTDAEVRAAAESELAATTLPESMRAGITELATRGSLNNATYINLAGALRSGELTPTARSDLEGAIARMTVEPTPPQGPTRGPAGGGPRTTRPEIDSAGLTNAPDLAATLADLLIPDGAPATALLSRASARAMLARMRLDPRTAGIADLIDNMIGNPERGIPGNRAIQDALGYNSPFAQALRNPDFAGDPYELIDPFTRRSMNNFSGQMERMVRPPVMEAVAEGSTGLPIVQPGETAAAQAPAGTEGALGGRVPIRASAGEGPTAGGGRGGGAGPGEAVPGRAGPAQGGGAGGPAAGGRGGGGRGAGPGGPRAGGPRAAQPAGEAPAEAAPAEGQQPQVLQLQRPPRWWTRAGGAVWRWGGRVRRGETGVQRRLKGETELAALGVLEPTTDTLVVRGIEDTARTSPSSIVEIMRVIYERAMAPGTRVAMRGQCSDILISLYRYPEVQALLRATRDPELVGMRLDVERSIDIGARSRASRGETQAARRQNYLDTLPSLTQIEGTPEVLARIQSQRAVIIDAIESRGIRAGRMPFVDTQALLGIELSAPQRAAAILSFERMGLVPPETIIDEMALARGNATSALNAIDTQGNPVIGAMRGYMLRRVDASRGGDAGAMLLDALRSDAVADTVGPRGSPARNIYDNAVREGNLDAVLTRINDAMPGDIGERVIAFARSVRGNAPLGESLGAMEALGPKFQEVQDAAQARGGGALVAGRPLGIGRGIRRVFTSRPARFVGRTADPSWSLRTGIGEFAEEARTGGWRAGVRESLWSGRTLWRAAHAAGWGVGLYFGVPAFVQWLTDSPDLREGMRIANELFGMNVSEANARWLITQHGRDFAGSMIISNPYLRPRDGVDLAAILDSERRGEMWVDPRRLNDALDDGRAMDAALSGLNERYRTATTGEGDARTTAARELGERLGRLSISADDIRAALAREMERTMRRSLNDQERADLQRLGIPEMLQRFLQYRGRGELNVADMEALRLEDWRRRGVVMDPRRAAVETYLRDARLEGTELASAITFFSASENADAFLALWIAARRGYIAAAYVDDAVRYLMGTLPPSAPGQAPITVLEAIRREADAPLQPTVTRLRQLAQQGLPPSFLDSVNALDEAARTGATDEIKNNARRELTAMLFAELLRRRLVEQRLYVEIPQASADLTGIRPNSLIQALDERAWGFGDYRPTFDRLLSTYRETPGAMRALNSFIVRDDEEIFGDTVSLAQRIAFAGGQMPGSDSVMRPVVDEINRLLEQGRSGDATARAAASLALAAVLSHMGLSPGALNTLLTSDTRRTIIVEDLVGLIADSARAEGILGPSLLVTDTDRSMLSADGPELVRFATRYSGTGGLLEWIRNNRENITNLRELLRYIEQNEFMRSGRRSGEDIAAFAERNVQVFKENGWFNPLARTYQERGGVRGITPAPGQAAAPQAAPAGGGRQAGRRAAPTISLEFRPEFPGVTSVEMVRPPPPVQAPATQQAGGPQTAQPAAAPATVTGGLTPEQRQQADAFYNSDRGRTLGVTINRLLVERYQDREDGALLTRLYGPLTTAPDGTPVVPPAAIESTRMEIYRILISPLAADATIRRGWNLPMGGAGDTLSVNIDIERMLRDQAYSRRVKDPLRNRIRQFVMEQIRAREGEQPSQGGQPGQGGQPPAGNQPPAGRQR